MAPVGKPELVVKGGRAKKLLYRKEEPSKR
jgi:hypothetical protein